MVETVYLSWYITPFTNYCQLLTHTLDTPGSNSRDVERKCRREAASPFQLPWELGNSIMMDFELVGKCLCLI